MMTCQQVTELITDYLTGHFTLLERARFQLHLGICRHCRRYLRQMKVATKALGRIPKEQIPPALLAELAVRFEGRRR